MQMARPSVTIAIEPVRALGAGATGGIRNLKVSFGRWRQAPIPQDPAAKLQWIYDVVFREGAGRDRREIYTLLDAGVRKYLDSDQNLITDVSHAADEIAAGRRPIAPSQVNDVQDLRFHATPRELRGLRNFVLILIAATAVFAVTALLVRRGSLEAWAAGAGLCALIVVWAYVMYARASTECTPAGIRTRGLGGRRQCSWPQVADIAIRPGTGTVIMVTRVDGTRFLLGVPVNGGVMRDPEFGSKLRQIQEYWRSASLAISSGPGEVGSDPLQGLDE